MIIDDFERESQKDLVYLLEAQAILEEEYREWLVNQQLPAKIEIIDESNLLKHKNDDDRETKEPEVLPF